MADAELKIKLIERKIKTKREAFLFGLFEAFGTTLGFAMAIGIVLIALHLFGVLPPDIADVE